MSDYAFVHDGKAFTPNQTAVKIEDVAAHNEAITQAELAHWRTLPDSGVLYYELPNYRPEKDDDYPNTFGASIRTWGGRYIGDIVSAHIYTHNFGGRFIAISARIEGDSLTGTYYHGRASYDNGNVIRLRKCKKA